MHVPFDLRTDFCNSEPNQPLNFFYKTISELRKLTGNLILFKKSLLIFFSLDGGIMVVLYVVSTAVFSLPYYLSDKPEGFTHERTPDLL